MRLTPRHLEYWRQRKLVPAWAAKIETHPLSKEPRVSIDEIVNLNAGPLKRKGYEFDANNAVSLMKLARKNGWLIECMQRCAYGPHRHQNKKRASYCAKWLRKLGQWPWTF